MIFQLRETKEEEKPLVQCKDDNCVPGLLIVFSSALPGNPQKEDLALSHIGFLQQDRMFNMTKSGRENMTVVQFEKQSIGKWLRRRRRCLRSSLRTNSVYLNGPVAFAVSYAPSGLKITIEVLVQHK